MKRILFIVIIILLANSIQALAYEAWIKFGGNHVKVEGDFYRLHEDEPIKCRNINSNRINLSAQLRMFLTDDLFIGIGNRINEKSAQYIHDGLFQASRRRDFLTTLDTPVDISYRFFSFLVLTGGFSASIPLNYDRLIDNYAYSDINYVRTTLNFESAISLQYKGFQTECRYIHELYSPIKPDDYGSNIVHRQLMYTIGFRLMDSRSKHE